VSLLGEQLMQWTGTRWVIAVSDEDGETTLAAQAAAAFEERRRHAANNPLVQEVLETFPGATIKDVRPRDPGAGNDGDETT